MDTSRWREQWPAADWATVLGAGVAEEKAIREATYSGRPLGSPDFVKQLESQLDRPLAPGKSGRPKRASTAAA